MPSATSTVTQIRNTAATALLLTAFLLSGTITSMDRVPMDIGEWIPEDAVKGALEAGAWMAEPSRGLVRDDRARPQVPHRVHQRTQDGAQAAQRASRGVRKFVTYVGPSIAADFAAGKVAKLDRREPPLGRRSTGPPPSRP